jgi:hypothetical protein
MFVTVNERSIELPTLTPPKFRELGVTEIAGLAAGRTVVVTTGLQAALPSTTACATNLYVVLVVTAGAVIASE